MNEPQRQDAAVSSATTTDAILGGRLTLRQPRRGHRAGTDAVLLAAAAPADIAGRALDIGAGVGTAGLILAMRCPKLRIGLVEKDRDLAVLAEANLAANGLASRGEVHVADLFSAAGRRTAGLASGMAQLVLTNPPFDDPARVRLSPDAGRRNAHAMAGEGGLLKEWVRTSLALLAPRGLFLMIHRPEALPEILAAIGQRLGEITVLPVHPRSGVPANRIILRGRKGSRAPFAIAPPLVLQEAERFTPLAEAIHRGEALLAW